MIKKLLLIGVLLAPALAYAGSPATDLSIQIAPASGSGGGGGGSYSNTITWNATQQQISGFGAYDGGNNVTPTTQGAQNLFTLNGEGIGLTYFRTTCTTQTNTSASACTSVDNCTQITQATSEGAKVFFAWENQPSDWAAANQPLDPSHYTAYANEQVGYLKDVESQCGVSDNQMAMIGIANEPDVGGGISWNDTTYDAYIKVLGPIMRANTGALLAFPEPSGWYAIQGNNYTNATFADPTALQYVGIINSHDYDLSTLTGTYPGAPTIPLWQTETSNVNTDPDDWTVSLADATRLHEWLVDLNANEWTWFLEADYCNSGNDTLLECSDNTTMTSRAYMIGQWSKFVRPGMYRITATETPASGVQVGAFQSLSSGAFAVVMVNNNASATPISYGFSGFTSPSLTPWVSSSTLHLAQQTAISAGSGFSYTLPADSVTTFVGTGTAGGGFPSAPNQAKAGCLTVTQARCQTERP